MFERVQRLLSVERLLGKGTCRRKFSFFSCPILIMFWSTKKAFFDLGRITTGNHILSIVIWSI